MDCIYIGGPYHGRMEDQEEVDGQLPVIITQTLAKSEAEAKEWVGLMKAGIEPPVGSFQVNYVRLSSYIDPAVYFFIGAEGQPPEVEEWEEEESD